MSITLRSKKHSLEVDPDLGGSILSFRSADGQNILSKDLQIRKNSSDRVACFMMAPFGNRLQNNQFELDGATVALKPNAPTRPVVAHGYVWQNSLDAEKTSSDLATLKFHHKAATWPWDFIYECTYHITDKALSIHMSVRNTSQSDMPCGLGIHPSLPFPSDSFVTFKCEYEHALNANDFPIQSVDCLKRARQSVKLKEVSGNRFFSGFSGKAIVHNLRDSTRTVIKSSPNANNLILFANPGEDSLCVEPMTHRVGAFNELDSTFDRPSLYRTKQLLRPGETLSSHFCIAPKTFGLNWDTTTTMGAYATEVMT